MADMTVTIDAETQRFLAKYQKLIAKNDELKQKLKDMGSAGRASGRDLQGGLGAVERGVLSATKAVVGFMAGFASIHTVVAGLRGLEQQLTKIAAQSSKSSTDLRSFLLLQDPGQVQPALAKVAKTVGKHGASPEEIGGIAATIQQLRDGNLEASLADIETGAKLLNLGVTPETASTMATAMIPKGISLTEGAAAFYKVAQEGPLEPEHIGQVAPSMAAYKDPMMAVYAAAGMATEGIPPEQLQQRTKALGMALQLDSDLIKKAEKAAKRQGMSYHDMDEMSQLELLKTVIPDLDQSGTLTYAEVMKSGIGEQRQSEALASALNRLDVIKQAKASAMGATPEFIDTEIAKLSESPGMRLALQEDTLQAQTQWMHLIGPLGDVARKEEERKVVAGAMAQVEGRSLLADPETGKGGWWARMFAEGSQFAAQTTTGPGQFQQAPARERTGAEALSALGDRLDKLTEAIIANTQATEGNSEATGATPAAPLTVGRNTDVEP